MDIKKLTGISACIALIAVCSWISIPFVIPFTLQTFAIFLTVGLLGGRSATIAVGVYILMGAIGLPVFAGFHGGAGVLFGSTGGYILGFLFSTLTMWLTESFWKKNFAYFLFCEILALVTCYFFGTLWYTVLYTADAGLGSFIGVMNVCVVPFLIPDAAKLVLASIISRRLSRILHLSENKIS